MLRQSSTTLSIRAPSRGLHEFTDFVRDFVAESGISEGLLTIFCRHTSASLVIQENAAPAARRDLEAYFERIAPEGAPYEHDDEGPDDMPAHIRTALTAVNLSIPIADGHLCLGTWQGIYVWEHRLAPHQRQVIVHVLGDEA